MRKKHYIFSFVLFQIFSFGQTDFSTIIGKECNITFFKSNGFKKITSTNYYKSNKSSKDKFIRGDKSVRIFRDSLIEFNWLKLNNKPKKEFTQYYKQDSLGHLELYDKTNLAINNNYIIKNSKVIRDNSNDYWYDAIGRLKKVKTIDTTWSGAVNCCGNVEEYKYYGDTVQEIYSYRYNGKPEYKFNETITTIKKLSSSVIVSTTDVYDYKLEQYKRVSTTTDLYLKTDLGVKCVTTTMDTNGEYLTITEYQ